MSVSVAAVMRQVNNHFVSGYLDADFAVEGGYLKPAPAASFVYIAGSVLHDGVWELQGGKLIGDGIADEAFTGRVWLLKPPRDFLALCREISAYHDKNPTGAPISESFGDYRVTRANEYTGGGGWQRAFHAQLTPFRRMFPEVFDDGA